ncbi:ATP-binding cassette transporter [Mycena sanguinolenta]|uniref:ATP-binding cassette transporter n=1 Tax=Mycena sanguinolenta TaxID=230812 RepID=A0A8H7CWR1_9AGAR|nr:ATP-binding cassette transporter [Mycena sanguinolenta]
MLGLRIFRTQALDASNCRHVLFRTAWKSPHHAASFSRPYFVPVQPAHLRLYSTKNQITEKPLPPSRPSILVRLLPQSFTASESASSLGKIFALAKTEKRTLLTAIGLLFVSAPVSMSVPFTIGKLIDFFSSANPQLPLNLSLWQASSLLLVVFTVGALANAGRALLMRMAAQRMIARLRERTYAAALEQEVEYVEKGEGDVLSRLSVDTSIVGESVTRDLSDGLRAVVMSSVGLGLMFYISPTLTMLMLLVVPPVSLGAVFYGRYLKKLSNQTQEAIGEMTKVASESLSALRTVQAYNAHEQERMKFHERINYVLSLAKKEATASAIFFGSTGWSGNVTILCLLGYGGTLVSKGLISIGDLTSLLLYTAYVGNGLSMLASFFTSIMRGLGAGTRVFELLDRTPAIPPHKGIVVTSDRRGVLKFENIKFEYPSRRGVDILKDFNLELAVGESVAIVGQSGGGKSSVHSLLLRYYDPIEGKITFDGQDIREFSIESWRSVIGIVPQDPVLFTGTIASNIAFGNPGATREQIEQAARDANCDSFIIVGRLSLSGGQRQRLAIARALLKKPALLALDEATSSLDATSEHRVNDAIDKILRNRQTTCLFVAHRLSTIARAERIVVLEGGRIVESGTYHQLVSREDSRFRALMAAQLTAAAGEKVTYDFASEAEAQNAQNASSVRKIVALAKTEKKTLLIALGLLFVSAPISMTVPFAIGKLIDFFSSTNPQLPLDLSTWQASSLLLLLFTTGAMANAGTALLMRMAGQRMIARLRERTYAAALEQEVEYVEKGEGDILSRLSVDTSIVGESVTRDLSDGLRAVVMSSVGLGLMFYVSPTLTMLMLVLVPSMSLGAVFYGRYLQKLSNRTQEAVGEMTKVASESLSALRTVQAYNAHEQERLKFHQRVKDVLSLAKKEATASAIFFGSTEWSGNVTILCLLGYGGILVSRGQISVGDLTSLIFYTAYVGNGLSMLASFFASIMRGIGAGTRIFQLLDRTPTIPPHNGIQVAPHRRGILKFENIKFEYPSL